MVKADAYGLGMPRVVAALCALPGPAAPWGYGVAAVAEGEALRACGWTGPVLVAAPAPPGEFARAAEAGLTLALSDLEAVRRWAGEARRLGRPLTFHAEIDTGMGRSGFPASGSSRWGAEVARLSSGVLDWEGCFTHFHSADEPDLTATDAQWSRFVDAVARLLRRPRLVHAANSAGALRRRSYAADLVRPGIYLYGAAAGPARPRPVAAVRARLSLIRKVEPGATAGYGATYGATRRERWGTVAIGYGDGLPRALGPAGGEAIVHGRRVPIIGRVSMDVITVDLTGVAGARVGDVATLIGRDGPEEITVDEVAARCATISYEILVRLGPRLPRVYLDDERRSPANEAAPDASQ